MNLYDFDKTIYAGDSTVDFYFFCLKKKITLIKYMPKQFLSILKYKFKFISKKKMKEDFFSFLKGIDNVDDYIEKFWLLYKKKIKKWYIDSSNKNDVIVSASPQFLLNPLKNMFQIKDIIASNVDSRTGNFLSENCYGEEKVNRIRQLYNNVEFINAYSDSLSDMPMLNLAENKYLIKKNKIIKM